MKPTANPDIQAVLFDLDGTLLDTARDFWDALNLLRAEERRDALSFEAVRCQVSHGGHALVRLGFGELPADEHEVMRMRLLNIYRKQLAKHTSLFEGGDEMLTEIERRGLHWGVVTNKPHWLTEPLLQEVNLHKRAKAVVSGDTLPERKPHPMPLLHAAKTLGVDPRNCVYVGDAERDIVAGRAAGMQTVVAGYGYLGPEDRPLQWNPHGIVQRAEDLLDWLTLRHLDSATGT